MEIKAVLHEPNSALLVQRLGIDLTEIKTRISMTAHTGFVV